VPPRLPPIPAPPQSEFRAWGYPFDYIQPRAHAVAMQKLWPGGNVEQVQGTGPAPLLMRAEDWIKVRRTLCAVCC
jgi:hypothetical protein